jgi:predicted transcriptional regulator
MVLLSSLKSGASSPKEISSETGQPLFKVRSSLRELMNAGFVEQEDGNYKLSQEGEKIMK